VHAVAVADSTAAAEAGADSAAVPLQAVLAQVLASDLTLLQALQQQQAGRVQLTHCPAAGPEPLPPPAAVARTSQLHRRVAHGLVLLLWCLWQLGPWLCTCCFRVFALIPPKTRLAAQNWTEVCLPGYYKTACKAAAELAPVPYTCVECVICA